MSFCLVMVLGTGLLCQETRVPIRVSDTACQAYTAISWSVRDTDQTILQIRQHNAVYDDLCTDSLQNPEGSGMR